MNFSPNIQAEKKKSPTKGKIPFRLRVFQQVMLEGNGGKSMKLCRKESVTMNIHAVNL